MKRCETCSHWVRNKPIGDWMDADEEPWEWAPWGQCALAASYDGAPRNSTRAIAMDGEAYRAYLLTDPTFCCTMYEEKA